MDCKEITSPTLHIKTTLSQYNSWTLIKEILRLFLKWIPEWKHSTLLGSALIDGTPTIDEIKKAAAMLAINNALLQ